MKSAGPNCFFLLLFTVLFIVFSFFSLQLILSIDKRESLVNSFQGLTKTEDYCRSRTSNISIDSAKACNCTQCVSESVSLTPSSSYPSLNGTVIVKEKVTQLPCEREGPWYAENTLWHYPTMFPRCSMDVCFNYSRCENMEDIRIFAYDPPSRAYIWYFKLLNSSKWFTNDPHKACLFFVYVDIDPWHDPPVGLTTLPYWNAGMNHVLVSFHDKWAHTKIPMDSTGFASLLITDMHETVYRPGFDISISLPPRMRPTQFQHHKPFHRKYLLTFRGLRYLGHEDVEGTFRGHESLRNMHNGKDIIVALHCRHPTNNYVRQLEPLLGAGCDEDEAIYDKYHYVDLMNSTFGLAPAGRQPASYRFTEILSAGTIPVLIGDNYVKPFDTLIQWHRCILQFPTKQMHRIVPILRRMSKEEAEERQKYCLQVYWEFLKDDETLVQTAVVSLKARMMGFFSNITGDSEIS